MNPHIKSYLIFLGFLVVTKMVVKPVVDKANIPLLAGNL